MINKKLQNLSKEDIEICSNYDFKVKDVQEDLYPMIYNVVVKELKNLQDFINDDYFLKDWFKGIKIFGREIKIIEGEFVLSNVSNKRLLDVTPREFFKNKYGMNSYSFQASKREYLLKNDLLNFLELKEDCKADYIREIKELNQLEKEIIEICENL